MRLATRLAFAVPALSDAGVRLRGRPLGREADRHVDLSQLVAVLGEPLSEVVHGAGQVGLSRLHYDALLSLVAVSRLAGAFVILNPAASMALITL